MCPSLPAGRFFFTALLLGGVSESWLAAGRFLTSAVSESWLAAGRLSFGGMRMCCKQGGACSQRSRGQQDDASRQGWGK
eukprot:7885698-Heterocapsa_arctica.AAC.1